LSKTKRKDKAIQDEGKTKQSIYEEKLVKSLSMKLKESIY